MKYANVSDRIKEAARKYVVSYSLFRPESALVIALTIALSGLAAVQVPWLPGQWWMYVTAGLLGEAAIVFSTLRDSHFYMQVMNRLFNEQYDLSKLRSPDLRQKLSKALEYRQHMIEEIDRTDEGVLDVHLRDATHGFEDWISQMYRVAIGIDAFQNDPLVRRDMEAVPKELAAYQQQLARSKGGPNEPEMTQTVSMKQAQYDALKSLSDGMSRAQMQLDHTLSAMGTLYSQTKLIGSKEASSTRAQRLQDEMREQVQALQDTQAALDEVYGVHQRAANLTA